MKLKLSAFAACLGLVLGMAGASLSAALAQSPGGNAPEAEPVSAEPVSASRPAETGGPVIIQIVVEGNRRVEEATVRQYLAFTEGEAYTSAAADQSLKTLTSTGLFSDVTIEQAGGVVVVRVAENPVINSISYEGNSRLSEDELSKESALKPRQILTRAKVQSDVTRMNELYRRAGRFAAVVEPKVVELPQNRVDVVFEIEEGPSTGISSINFIGNQVYSERELRQQIVTTESAWWNFFTSQDNYDPDRVAFDREQLRRFYLRNGYADFKVISAVADLDRDKSGFYITFTVDEGRQYDFGNVEVQTQIPDLDADEMVDLVRFSTGDTYNAELIEKSVEELTFYAGTRGYAFAQVRPRLRRNIEEGVIEVSFDVQNGPRVYIDRINIIGNTRTLDKVIRREFRLSEGDAYNKVLVDRSRTRIRSLGFFKDVKITEERGSAPDRTSLNVQVEETTTGELQFGLGYSSQEGLVGDISISERNLLGRGQFLRLRVSLSSLVRQIDFRFTEPYFLDRNLALGVDAYNIFQEYEESSYDATTTGGGLRLGFPLSEFSRLGLRYTLRQDEIRALGGASPIIILLSGDFLTSVFGADYVYDDRDDPQKPTSGFLVQVSADFAGLGGDVKYYRGELDATWYQRLWSDDLVFSLGVNAGYIGAWDSNTPIRLNDRFFKGGATFRGFKTAGVGPRETAVPEFFTGDSTGAEAFVIGTAELTVPNFLPEQLGIDTSLFVDVGTVGLNSNLPATNCLPQPPNNEVLSCIQDDFGFRASAGVSVFWDSPFGRVRLDFSQILAKEDYDQAESFRFSAGTQF